MHANPQNAIDCARRCGSVQRQHTIQAAAGSLQLKHLWNRHGIFNLGGPNPFPKYLQPKMCFKYLKNQFRSALQSRPWSGSVKWAQRKARTLVFYFAETIIQRHDSEKRVPLLPAICSDCGSHSLPGNQVADTLHLRQKQGNVFRPFVQSLGR